MDYIRKVDSELMAKLEKFHGALVPGLLIGAYMVELAYEKLSDDARMIDAVVESKKCIADAVQVMTSCTLGNGWLKVYDWGIFAITLYDKKSKKGVRVYLDVKKLPKESITYKWFFREVDKDSHEEVNKELLVFKKEIFSHEYVQVEIKKKERARVSLCARCGYPFLSEGSNECISCREGSTYYLKVS
ncbi:MAG: formylmethanofuran dehydrogenase subunit E family protein [bacterium]